MKTRYGYRRAGGAYACFAVECLGRGVVDADFGGGGGGDVNAEVRYSLALRRCLVDAAGSAASAAGAGGLSAFGGGRVRRD